MKAQSYTFPLHPAMIATFAVLNSLVVTPPTHGIAADIDFDRQIAPILIEHCIECHAGKEPEGGLSLLSMDLAEQGGDSGPAWDRQTPTDSLLWQRIDSGEMPPKGKLSHVEKSAIQQWIEQGGAWSTRQLDPFARSTAARSGRDWWSLQPIETPEPPTLAGNGSQLPTPWGNNAIDSFILHGLKESDLRPAPPAEPRSLIRRLYFDLIGLPPTPEQVEAFVAQPDEAAYVAVVDELLASEHYGQRWARHWLDVVRYGESDGFERNAPRENSWPYRDWVINALNADMPYDEFVRMQLIGDQVVGGQQGAAATGFWVAGVHNTVVGGSPRMKALARQDEIEEVLAVVGQTFVGLTVNCARCHDHKFDPISQVEYYQLASAISGLGYGQRVEQSAQDVERLQELDARLQELRQELSSLDRLAMQAIQGIEQSAGSVTPTLNALARWTFDEDLSDSLGQMHGQSHGEIQLQGGALVLDGNSYVETPPLASTVTEKTLEVVVQLDNLDQRGGAAISIGTLDGGVFDAIVFAEGEPLRWMAGSNSFVRTEPFDAPNEEDAVNQPVHLAIVYNADGTVVAYRQGQPYGHAIRKSDLQTYEAGRSQLLFGLRHKPPGGNRFLKAKIHQAAFYDRALNDAEVAELAQASIYPSEEQIAAMLDETQLRRREALRGELKQLAESREQTQLKATQTFFTLTPGNGEVTRVLLRGDPDLADEVVPPGGLQAVSSLSADFGMPPDADEADRRIALANWIVHPDNPLFPRVMVNRLWHYHLGRGLVPTPNDFGFNGGLPSHPALLDYLAHQFRSSGYRLKDLHRLIVTSSTYRQSSNELPSVDRERGLAVDQDNRLLWRGYARRLDAESIRDAMLLVAGQLSATSGGASFKDVSVTENNGTTYYEPLDANGPEYWRRTVYRFNPRGGRSALLDAFDCPDTAATSPRRMVTTTPLQALSLLNNTFVLRMSTAFAERLRREADGLPAENKLPEQIDRAWRLTVARSPSAAEYQLSLDLVEQHGLEALCRGLFNANEFVWLD